MLYKLRNMVFCCSALFLITSVSVAPALAAQSQNHSSTTMAVPNTLSKQAETVNINSADIISLQKVKGMSKKKAQAIIEYRDKNGPFKSLEDLLKVNCRGIHKKWLDKISKSLSL